MQTSPYHSFHIPVLGLAYSIDSPVKVARYGISSVISIVEDGLVEMMRKHYCLVENIEYEPITIYEADYRAKRITKYLNLVNQIVESQVEKLRDCVFEAGSEIVKYFEMLPNDGELKEMYRLMMSTFDKNEKVNLQTLLRAQIKAGSIDVNIMTKVDKENYDHGGMLMENGSDAVAALRGYVNSTLKNSSIVFSAGLNPRLFNYMEQRSEFDLTDDGVFIKKVTIKVSDYRSALIQGKYLAKKGIWVSEFRLESGLNCGGHAFATEGLLMGPILEEFKDKKQELIQELFEIYTAACKNKQSNFILNKPPHITFSAQGGIGTNEEDVFLRKHYQLGSTGWGTPFLMVNEATTVDGATLKLLAAAKEENVLLSHNSPLGIRFYTLEDTTAALEKKRRILNEKPGSPCPEKHLAFNKEFTKEGICTASRKYQKLKLLQLKSLKLSDNDYNKQEAELLSKECLCVGLANAAAICYKQSFVKNLSAVTICPGPNIAYFSDEVSLWNMIDHIYGRTNIIKRTDRPHMFIKELNLYINYLKEQLEETIPQDILGKRIKYFTSFYHNLKSGISYYRQISDLIHAESEDFNNGLVNAEEHLDSIYATFETNTLDKFHTQLC
ncbi:MAG: hypothetical protein IPO92_15925 [Saprospiraceae bacterium]|nr:hypothetical protein [Saprospiraceae bacterium]